MNWRRLYCRLFSHEWLPYYPTHVLICLDCGKTRPFDIYLKAKS